MTNPRPIHMTTHQTPNAEAYSCLQEHLTSSAPCTLRNAAAQAHALACLQQTQRSGPHCTLYSPLAETRLITLLGKTQYTDNTLLLRTFMRLFEKQRKHSTRLIGKVRDDRTLHLALKTLATRHGDSLVKQLIARFAQTSNSTVNAALLWLATHLPDTTAHALMQHVKASRTQPTSITPYLIRALSQCDAPQVLPFLMNALESPGWTHLRSALLEGLHIWIRQRRTSGHSVPTPRIAQMLRDIVQGEHPVNAGAHVLHSQTETNATVTIRMHHEALRVSNVDHALIALIHTALQGKSSAARQQLKIVDRPEETLRSQFATLTDTLIHQRQSSSHGSRAQSLYVNIRVPQRYHDKTARDLGAWVNSHWHRTLAHRTLRDAPFRHVHVDLFLADTQEWSIQHYFATTRSERRLGRMSLRKYRLTLTSQATQHGAQVSAIK